jgi:hypothetical protein
MPLILYFIIYYTLFIAAPAATSKYLKPLVIVFNGIAAIFRYPISGVIINFKANDLSGKITCKSKRLLPLKITTPN